MPIDINLLRADRGGNPDAVRVAQRKRFKPEELVDNVLALDVLWREQITLIRNLNTRVNKLQREVIAQKMRDKMPCDEELAEKKKLEEEIKQIEEEHARCECERDELICRLGNAVDDSVPFSKDEDEDNEVVCVWPLPHGLQLPCRLGKISYPLPEAKPLTHDDLLWRVGGYDPVRGSKVAGGRGYFLCDVGVLLNQAIINFAIKFLRERCYSAMQTPFFMKKDLMAGIAQLADFDEQLYKVTTGKTNNIDDPADKYLIATSEQPLCALHCKETLDERELPLRYAGVSTCFRKEVGKANQDNRGIFRVHQFEKVEQFCITKGDLEESKRMHQEMLQCAEDFHKALGIAYRVVNIVSGELNDAAMIKYDLEGWFPGQGQYRELVSCSNCTDFQSRALDVRYRAHKADNKNSTVQLAHVHMLNSTLTATGRAICCILETYQTPDGVQVPESLVPYMGGTTFIPFVRGPRDIEGGVGVPKTDVKCPRPALGEQLRADVKCPRPGGDEKLSRSLGAAPLLVDGVPQLDALEAKLLNCSYVDGFRPSQLDVAVLAALEAIEVDVDKYPNIRRWMVHVMSFTPLERASWG